MHIAAVSAPVELPDSSDSIDDRLLMFTFSGRCSEEGLRSNIHEKKNSINKQV